MEIIEKLLKGKYDNHIMPFLWMHGESHEVIKDYLEHIAESGIRAICLESRPYEEFLKAAWWNDLDFIVQKCEELDMKVWILDDKHFPTGYAAGAVEKKYPHLRKKFLEIHTLDFVGPKRNAKILLKWLKLGRQNIMDVGRETEKNQEQAAKILAVLAAPKTDANGIDEEKITVLSYDKEEEILYWNLPEGEWKIILLSVTQEGGEAATKGYLNPLVKEATQVLVDTVYEPHYEHLKDKFGTVIKGFFSDEPRFGNIKGMDASIGRKEMPLPWKDGLEEELAIKAGIGKENIWKYLVLLFMGDSERAHEIRYHYMDLVSRTYAENFSEVIGKWCEKHGVEYIGHVLEDNNAHARLGYGAGHFFRALSGQHMSGIDVVLHQLMPRQNNSVFQSYTSAGWDGEFFTYGLAKMGASLGALDPRKKGRTMCEVFGAYGWSEGLRMMKWITDHMLANGVNYFVPHAFDLKKFPDTDCPPHFYIEGNDAEFEYMKILNGYTNRIATLLSEGKHGGNVGVLYHGKAEWAGEYMLFQKPVRVLAENQVEHDIISEDMLMSADLAEKGTYCLNEKYFCSLVIPYGQRMTKELAVRISELAENGVKVLFVENFPQRIIGDSEGEVLARLRRTALCTGLKKLTDWLPEQTDRIETRQKAPYLRYYHYIQEDGDIRVLFNEDLYQKLETDIILPESHSMKYYGYHPMENSITEVKIDQGKYHLFLDKGEMMILFAEKEKSRRRCENIPEKVTACIALNEHKWEIEVKKGFGKPEKSVWEFETLPELEQWKVFRDFSGELIYRTKFENNFAVQKKDVYLEIEDANEVVKVLLNGNEIGARISYPYRFEMTDYLQEGENHLEIHVINNMGNYMKDYLSQFMFLEEPGINGKVKITVKE